jgi:hypothetical protein
MRKGWTGKGKREEELWRWRMKRGGDRSGDALDLAGHGRWNVLNRVSRRRS